MKFGDLNIPPLSTLINVRSHSALRSMRGWSCKFVTHCHVLFEENFRTKNSVKISDKTYGFTGNTKFPELRKSVVEGKNRGILTYW